MNFCFLYFYIVLYTFYVGILAGMRPCGIIVLLSELFSTESKSQVYATLHEYFRRNSVASNNIGKQTVKLHIWEI